MATWQKSITLTPPQHTIHDSDVVKARSLAHSKSAFLRFDKFVRAGPTTGRGGSSRRGRGLLLFATVRYSIRRAVWVLGLEAG